MNEYINYTVESGISLAVLFILYAVFLSRETFFGMIRSYLMLSIVFSFMIPLLHISSPAPGVTMPVISLEEVTVSSGTPAGISHRIGLTSAVFYLYLLVSTILLARLLVNLCRIFRLIKNNRVQKQQGCRLVYLQQNLPPFSFFNYIFISKQYLVCPVNEIIEHEMAHIKQLHSFDVLLAELLIILQWFNPFAWLYRKTLRENHEYFADRSVLKSSHDPESYQVSILSQLFGVRTVPATNNFNKSITRKRLHMMEKKRSNQLSKLKFMLAIPVAGLLFFGIACGSQDTDLLTGKDPAAEASGEQPGESPDSVSIYIYLSGAAEAPGEQPGESLVYFQPDESAVYPGGMEALRRYIAENLRYPDKAKEKGVEGKVFIQFVVDEQGKVIPVTAEKGAEIPPPPPPPAAAKTDNVPGVPDLPDVRAVEAEGIVVVGFYPPEGSDKDYSKEDISLLEQEAIRVIKSIPPFEKPAMVDGKPVKCLFTFPINFKLQ